MLSGEQIQASHLGELALLAFRLAPDGIVCVDEAGRMVFINDVARALFGDRVPTELLNAALQGRRVTDEGRRVRRPDGSLREVRCMALPLIEDGHTRGAVLVVFDVTERSEIERTLRFSQSRFRALEQATSQMVWTTDAEGVTIEDSPSWRKFTGQTFQQFQGWGWLDALHPDDRERAEREWKAAVARRDFFEIEYRIRRHDGAYHWIAARGAPIFDENGELRQWIGCCWDIHSLKQAQEEQARISHFQRMLMGIVGHDLRNPIASIGLATSMLERPDQGPHVNGLAKRLRRGVERATSIIDLLLDLTQATLGGGIRLNRIECELAAVAADIIAEQEGQSSGRPLSLNVEGDTVGNWDCARVGQIVANLVGNALQHGTAGTPVNVRVAGNSREVMVEVVNSAPPIAKERLERLFDPFERNAESGRQNLGLGLFIVKQLVQAHKGTIAVESNVERTCFCVRLPRA